MIIVKDLIEVMIGVQCDCADRTTPPNVLGKPIKLEPINNPEDKDVWAWYCPECDRSVAISISAEHVATAMSEEE